jgi:hypothetical protein
MRMMASLWPTMASTIRAHASGSSRGLFTLRSMTQALAE